MNDQHDTTRDENEAARENNVTSAPAVDASQNDDEFRLTIRKLDMPVRPRGVLAE